MLGASARGAQSFTLGRQQSSGDEQGDRNKAMLTSVMTLNCTLENGYQGNSVLYVFHLNKEKIFNRQNCVTMLCDPKETHPLPHCSRHLRLPPAPGGSQHRAEACQEELTLLCL